MTPLSDLLRDVLPPAVRKYVYAVLALVALVWGIWQGSDGDWGQFVAAVVASLTGALAASNTPSEKAAPPHVVPAEPLEAPNEDYEPRHVDE